MTQHSKQDTSWRVPATTLFLIALWVMTASLGVTQYITLLLPIQEIQTTTLKTLPTLKTHVVNLKRDMKDLSRDLQRLEVRGKLGSKTLYCL